jgi:hypothetical protein
MRAAVVRLGGSLLTLFSGVPSSTSLLPVVGWQMSEEQQKLGKRESEGPEDREQRSDGRRQGLNPKT